MTHKLILKAKRFATQAHDGQTRSDGAPYITHPAQTAAIISQSTNDPEIIAAAWLHDTIEDTDTTYETLVTEFGQTVADLVMEVTAEREPAKHFPRLKTQAGIMIKLSDRLSNISDMKGWTPRKKQYYMDKTKFWTSEA